MQLFAYRNTMRTAKLPPAPTRETVPVLSMPEPQIRFISKQRKTKTLREERAEMASRVAEVDNRTTALVENAEDRDKPISAIILDVAREFNVSAHDIKGPCRAKFLVAVRHHAMVRVYLAHRHKASFPMMGRAFGGRDHATFLNALRKFGVWEGQGGPRISDEINERIRELSRSSEGYSSAEIASMCGVGKTHVLSVIRGVRWDDDNDGRAHGAGDADEAGPKRIRECWQAMIDAALAEADASIREADWYERHHLLELQMDYWVGSSGRLRVALLEPIEWCRVGFTAYTLPKANPAKRERDVLKLWGGPFWMKLVDPSLPWFVIWTAPSCEDRAERSLRDAGYQVYVEWFE